MVPWGLAQHVRYLAQIQGTLKLPPVLSDSVKMRLLVGQDEKEGLAVGNIAGFPLPQDKLPGENGLL